MPKSIKRATVKQIAIIGAGAAGFSVALSLSKLGWNVTLIEKNTLCSGATGNNPGRMGLGLHYADLNTAMMYMHASIKVQRTYPGYLVAQEKNFGRGRYYIMKDTTVPKEKILSTYKALQAEYAAMIEADPANEVFGRPDDFFRILERDEFSPYISLENVDIGIECAEHIFNWPEFAKDIRTLINDDPNIHLLENTELVGVDRGEVEEDRFILRLAQKEVDPNSGLTFTRPINVSTNHVANSTWANIEEINEKIGLRMVPGSRTNRLKCLLKVKLPPSLREEPSAFFLMGPHCMFSNMGDGYGMMTYANVTNMEVTQNLGLSDDTQRLINGGATLEEKAKLAAQILGGVVKYIPEMAFAEICDVKFGIVRTEGTTTLNELHSPSSSVFKRDSLGIEILQQGWTTNPSTKLFYFLENAEVVSKYCEVQHTIASYIEKCFADLSQMVDAKGIKLPKEVWKTLALNLDLYTPSESYTSKKPNLSVQPSVKDAHNYLNSEAFMENITNKMLLNREILRKGSYFRPTIKMESPQKDETFCTEPRLRPQNSPSTSESHKKGTIRTVFNFFVSITSDGPLKNRAQIQSMANSIMNKASLL